MKAKKLIYWTLSILVAVALIDVAFGYFFRFHLQKWGFKGDYESVDYLMRNYNDDVLIMGSSVALNSLDSKQLTDSLDATFYNGSSNGQNLTYFVTVLKMMLQQGHTPKKLILGLHPGDLSISGIGSRFNLLNPYYGMGYQSLDSTINTISPLEKIKMKSSLYRLNTIWFRILLYDIITPGVTGQRGFIAKPIPFMYPTKKPATTYSEPTEERMAQIKEFVDICKRNNIEMMVYYAPIFANTDNGESVPELLAMRKLCEKEGIPFYNDIALTPFDTDSTLYYDNMHLNVNGAKEYTNIFINRLKQ